MLARYDRLPVSNLLMAGTVSDGSRVSGFIPVICCHLSSRLPSSRAAGTDQYNGTMG